jgi:DNA-binding HxlR family transcriptional regulator
VYLQFLFNMTQSSNILDSHPYLRQTLTLICDKWVTPILYVLSHGKKRHGELQREIGDVSQRMLTRTLRDLERDGLVRREVLSKKPLTVEYSLTSLGETLVVPLRLLCQWSIDHFHEVETSRANKDNNLA